MRIDMQATPVESVVVSAGDERWIVGVIIEPDGSIWFRINGLRLRGSYTESHAVFMDQRVPYPMAHYQEYAGTILWVDGAEHEHERSWRAWHAVHAAINSGLSAEVVLLIRCSSHYGAFLKAGEGFIDWSRKPSP